VGKICKFIVMGVAKKVPLIRGIYGVVRGELFDWALLGRVGVGLQYHFLSLGDIGFFETDTQSPLLSGAVVIFF